MPVIERSPRRVLVVSLDNLGDLVFASALTPPLHRAFPDATIDVWCKKYTAPIAPLIPHVGDVIAGDPFWAVSPAAARPSIRDFVGSVVAVRRHGYDVAILSAAPWRTAAAVALTGIPVRVGLARHRNSRFLTDVLSAENVRKPVLEEQARLLGALGVSVVSPRYRLERGPLQEGRTEIEQRLARGFIALHPFAGQRNRCVPMDEWLRLAGSLRARGDRVLWIGTSHELSNLRRSYSLPESTCVDEIGQGSLTATAAALSLAKVFVGHDSGPLHVASALGTSVVGIFAPGQPERTFPQGIGPSRVLHSPTPAGISAEQMLREVDAVLVSSPT
jgi:ADP-heptose:LPS heptosyltransferase